MLAFRASFQVPRGFGVSFGTRALGGPPQEQGRPPEAVSSSPSRVVARRFQGDPELCSPLPEQLPGVNDSPEGG